MARRKKRRSTTMRTFVLFSILILMLSLLWLSTPVKPSVDLAPQLRDWIASANEKIILIDARASYVNDDIAHLYVTRGWYTLDRATQQEFVGMTTAYWARMTGKDDPSWFLHDLAGQKIAGYSVFKGAFFND